MNEELLPLEITKQIEENKTLPQENTEKIHNAIFAEVFSAIIVIVYFYFVNLGFMNIEQHAYSTDLKVFSMSLLAATIILFENAYKKESGKLAIYGIEVLTLAIVTLSFTYVSVIQPQRYLAIVASLALLYAIYYLIKASVIQRKLKKEYYTSLNDIKDIVKKEIPKKEAKRRNKKEKK